MNISLENLDPDIQRYIRHRLNDGSYQSPEELINAVLREDAKNLDTAATPRKPSMGMYVDRNVPITFEEIEESSREAFENFPKDLPQG